MLKIVIPPAELPVTIYEIKDFLRISSDSEDERLIALATAATMWVENYCRIAVMTQTCELKVNPRNRNYLYSLCRYGRAGRDGVELPLPPLQYVESIRYRDVPGGEWQEFDDWWADEWENKVYPHDDSAWPDGEIIIRYVCGYYGDPYVDASRTGSVPAPLKQAVLILCDHWYENREPSTDGRMTMEYPFHLKTMLSPYVHTRFA